MRRIPWALLVLGLLSISSFAQETDPLKVLARVQKGPYYVGQSIVLQVAVSAAGERPHVATPRVADADVSLLGTDLRPISTSGIGSVVVERNAFLTRFRLVPRRPGALVIPPISARLGDRSGTSTETRVSVRALPVQGRPASFLGGVGAFHVEAEASPATVRAGESLEYLIRVTGPGARGMRRAPEVRPPLQERSSLRIEPRGTDHVNDPPSRVFRYRVRPTRAGRFVIPPVAVAAFDPVSGRYMTKVTSGVPVDVVEVPRFDPAGLEYPGTRITRAVQTRWLAGSAVALVGGLVGGAVWFFMRSSRGSREMSRALRRLFARIERDLDPTRDPSIAGRAVSEGLAAYLNLMAGRPSGALTPAEAEAGIGAVTHDEQLASQAGRLIALSDRAQFAEGRPSTAELIAAARAFLSELVRWRALERDEGEGWKNRERQSEPRPHEVGPSG